MTATLLIGDREVEPEGDHGSVGISEHTTVKVVWVDHADVS